MRVPGVDTNAGGGGLLGLALSPSYGRDRLVYAYFTSGTDNRIVRFRLGGSSPGPHRARARRSTTAAGSRSGRTASCTPGSVRRGTRPRPGPWSLNGKILRMNPDGSVPAGNPFPGSLVWTLGHRNVQGLAWDSNGRLWATEFGENASTRST